MSPRGADPDSIVRDLADEHSELDALVGTIPQSSWDLPTPSQGWSVRDQISHLAFFDEIATEALLRPEPFSAMARAVLEQGGDPMEEHLRRGRDMSPADLLDWWRRSRAELVKAVGSTSPDAKVPWFGPPMGLKSFVSARLMETWAHGNDVADALGSPLAPTDRLRHVAHLGVRTRKFSYLIRGLEAPPGSVHVDLSSPSGATWTWDEPTDASPNEGAVRGSALDFCLVVTQRRNVLDTSLETEGALASEWMKIAQAFAGPPGAGRAPSRREGGA